MDDRRPTTLVNSRRVVEWLQRRFWQVLTTFCTFSNFNDKVILIESISIPRYSIFWHGCKINIFIFIVKPKFCRRYMTVSRLMGASRIVWLKINISSKYIIALMLIFIRREIEIFNNYVNTLGLVQNTGTWTRGEFPFTETLGTSSSFDPVGHWSMHPSGPVCTSNLPPVLSALTEKGLPFWNQEKEWTGSTFLDWLQGDTLRNKLLKNSPWAGWVLFIAPFLNISFNSKSTRAIYCLFILVKLGIFCWKGILINGVV